MRVRLSVFAVIASCVGLGTSLASLTDYLGADASFCAASGCSTVRASAWAMPLGIPMPVFGVIFFAAMVVLSVVARPKLRLMGALGGAAFALALIGVQAFALHAWCKLCLVSDLSAIALGVAVVCGARTVTTRSLVLAAPAVALVPIAFLAFSSAAPAPAPPSTDALALDIPHRPGEVTVVEFVDFECPFCRRLAPTVEAAIASATVPVNVVRKMVPLKMHPHARDAAIAWCCADAQGKGDAMAAALYATEPDALTPENCERVAVRVGCDLAMYRASLADPATARRIDSDLAMANAAGVNALPTIFIGDEHFTGANHDAPALVAAIERARN